MFCKYCGKEIPEGIKFCKYCGGRLSISEENNDEQPEKENYGTFWPRFGAYFIDLILILIVLIIIALIFGISWGSNWDNIVSFIALIIYHTFFLSFYSSTPGKMLFGLRVVNEKTNDKLSPGRAFGRSFSYFMSSILFGIGFLKIAFDKKKHKGWHDGLAGTVVLQKEYNKKRAGINN